MTTGQQWTVGDAATVIDADSPYIGRTGRVTGLTRRGAISVRFAGWTYETFASHQVRRATEPPAGRQRRG